HKLRERTPNPSFPWHWAHRFIAFPSQPPVAHWSSAKKSCSKPKPKYGFVGGKKRFQLCFVRNFPRARPRAVRQNENPARAKSSSRNVRHEPHRARFLEASGALTVRGTKKMPRLWGRAGAHSLGGGRLA